MCDFRKTKTNREKSSLFISNGNAIIKEIIALSGGKYNPLRNFTAEEIILATDNFRKGEIAIERASLYRGCFEGCSILVKLIDKDYVKVRYLRQEGPMFDHVRGLAIASQVSHHKNVLKLLGYCLEFDYPIGVYEDPGGLEQLSYLLSAASDNPRTRAPLSWSSRLRIAKGIANILVYLHTAFPTPLIYKNMKPSAVFVDKCGVVKLHEFSFSLALPLGESEMLDPILSGTLGYMCPSYYSTQIVSTKYDVYSFGVVLTNLVGGSSCADLLTPNYFQDYLTYYEEGDQDRLRSIVDQSLLIRGVELEQEEQVRALLNLAIRCIEEEEANRPEMIDVAKELERIEKIHN